MKSQRRRRSVYVCGACGAEYAGDQGRCSECGEWGTLQRQTAERRKDQEALTPEAQAVVELLVAGLHETRKEVQSTVEYLLREKPKGIGLSGDRLARLADDLLERQQKEPKDKPLGYLVTLARQPEKKRATVEESFRPLAKPDPPAGRQARSLKEVLADSGAKVPKRKRKAASKPRRDPGECKMCAGASVIVVRRPGYVKEEWGEQEVATCPGCRDKESPDVRRARLLSVSGLSETMMSMTLDSLQDLPGLAAAAAAASRFLQGQIRQLVLVGRPGRGKTHVAVGTLLACIERGEPGYYLNVARFLDELRMTYDVDTPQTFAQLMGPPMTWPVVVLDDLAGERRTDWAQEKLYEIVDSRYSKALRTIACSNVAAKFWDPRVLSRLGDTRYSEMVVLETADYRLSAAATGG